MQALKFSVVVLPLLFMVNYISLINANKNLQKRNELNPTGIRREATIRHSNPVRSGRIGKVAPEKTSNGRIIFYDDNNEPLLPGPTFPPYPGKKSAGAKKPLRPPVRQSSSRPRKPPIEISTSRSRSRDILVDGGERKKTPRVQKLPTTTSITQRPQKSNSTLPTTISRKTTPRVDTRESRETNKSNKTVTERLQKKEPIAQGSYYVPFRKQRTYIRSK